MIVALLLGAAGGAGLLVLRRGLVPVAEPLSDALDRLAGAGAASAAVRPAAWRRHVRSLAGGERRSQQLRLVGRSPERHALDRLLAVLAGGLTPIVLAVVLGAGGIGVDPVAVVIAAVAFAAAGVVLPDLVLRDQAARRRRQLRQALSSFLDLVEIVIAGGAGIETALMAAADAGDGWAFAELRGALARSMATRRSPWACLEELGLEVGLDELVELAASIRLAGEHGARIKSSLAARAASLRGHQLAEVEASAQAASERMALPTVLLFVGFLAFIGYPALTQILGGSGL